jgi:hypothetical protein
MGIFEIIMLIVGLAAGAFGGRVIGKRQGIKQERVSQRMKNAEVALRGKEIDDEVDDMGDADRRDELSKWVPKGE